MLLRWILTIAFLWHFNVLADYQLVERKPWILKLTTSKLELNINLWLKLEYDVSIGALKVSVDDISVPSLTSYTYNGKTYFANSIPSLYPYFKNCGVKALSIDAFVVGTSCQKIQLVMFNIQQGDQNANSCPRNSGELRITDAKIWDSSLFGVLELESAINDYERNVKTNSEVEEILKDATQQFNSKAYKQAMETAEKGLAKNPKDQNLLSKLQNIVDKSKQQLEQVQNDDQGSVPKGKDPASNVNSQNSNSSQSSSQSPTDQQVPSTSNKPTWSAQDTQNYLEQQRQQSEQQIQNLSNLVDDGVNNILQTYYMQQSFNKLNDNIDANRNLNGNYSSVEELEREFNEKQEGLKSAYNAYNNQIQQNYSNLMQKYNVTPTSGQDGIEQGLEMAITGIASIISANKADKDKKQALQELERQREIMLADLKQKKLEMRDEMRRQLLVQFPPGGVPMTKDRLKCSEVYFFFYSYDGDYMNQEDPTFLVSNVFTVSIYKDKTWPLESTIVKEIRNLGTKPNLVLMGYYNDAQFATDMRNSFYNLARKAEIDSENLDYAGKEKKVNSQTESKSPVDFWGKPIQTTGEKKVTEKKIENQPQKKEPDYWGKPIEKK